jgi:hypothetical protein
VAKKQNGAKKARPDVSSDQKDKARQSSARSRPQPDVVGTGSTVGQQPGCNTGNIPTGSVQDPPAGLDTARHAAAQRRAQGAELLRKGAFSALMATALAIDPFLDAGAYRLYLDQVKEDAGSPTDPIEVMLIEQLCMAHWRIAQLHGSAALAKSIEGTKMYNSVASRLLGEFRRTALALRAYQASAPKGKTAANLKLFKAAQ